MTMKAVLATRYGSPDVLEVRDIAKPTPKPGEILVKVHAAVVGPSDAAFRKGDPFIVRLIYGLNKPRLATQGVEFSGVVEAVGEGVTGYKPGDSVVGMSVDRFGAHAQYLVLPVKQPLCHKPINLSYEAAVGICDGAATAMTFLKQVAQVKPGQRVLINGASGAVGAYGVQIAKHLGAHVTGVCSGANLDLVRSLGADEVMDYTAADFTRSGQTYDVVFDAVGKSSFGKCKRLLTPSGVYLTTVPTLGMLFDLLRTRFTRKKAKFATAGLMQTGETLHHLMALAEVGVLRPVIDRRYPLAQAADAHRYVDTGRKRGNVVLTVAGGL